ncbi:hypothetical protein [uncultured Clostridium sp.]|nr:hypothetical protein [uncultured Clostridium sp.]
MEKVIEEVKEFANTQDILSKNLFEGMKKARVVYLAFFLRYFLV